MFTELQISNSSATLVVSQLTGTEVNLPTSVTNLQAIDSEGIVPTMLEPHVVTVTTTDGSSYQGKLTNRDGSLVTLEYANGTMILPSFRSIAMSNSNTWTIDRVNENTKLHGEIRNLCWQPEYTMILDENNKIKQLALCARIQHNSQVFSVDRIVFRVGHDREERQERGYFMAESIIERSERLPSVSNRKYENGMETFTLNTPLEIKPQMVIPLWSNSYSQEQSYQYRIGNPIEGGFSIDLQQPFTPLGKLWIYNNDGVCVSKGHSLSKTSSEIWIPIGPAHGLEVNTSEISRLFGGKSTVHTIISKLSRPITLIVSDPDNPKVQDEWVIEPGTNQFFPQ